MTTTAIKLAEGVHWQHFPKAQSRTLAVFYSPVNVQPPTLPYFKTTEPLQCGRLLINTGTNNFYQDCIPELLEILSAVSAEYEETIHYGYSQGATGALEIGLRDDKCTAIFGVSPHFVMDRPYSRTADLMDPNVLAMPRQDLLERLRAETQRKIFLFLSVLDVQDGVQVRDSLSLSDTHVTTFYLKLSHFLPGINQPEAVIGQYLTTRNYALPPTVPVATRKEREDAIMTYDMMVAVRSRKAITGLDTTAIQQTDNSYLLYWLGRYLEIHGDLSQGIVSFVKAYELGRGQGGPNYEILICCGNALSKTGARELALGYYRQARETEPLKSAAWLCEAALLRHMKRQKDLGTLGEMYLQRVGDDATLAQLRAS